MESKVQLDGSEVTFWASQWLKSGKSLKETCVYLSCLPNTRASHSFKDCLKQSALGLGLDEAFLNARSNLQDPADQLLFQILHESARMGWDPKFTGEAIESAAQIFGLSMVGARKTDSPPFEVPVVPQPKPNLADLSPQFLLEDAILLEIPFVLYGLDQGKLGRLHTELINRGAKATAILAATYQAACFMIAETSATSPQVSCRKAAYENLGHAPCLFFEIGSDERREDPIEKVVELYSYRNEQFWFQTIMKFKITGMSRDQKLLGHYIPGGFVPDYVSLYENKGFRCSRGTYYCLTVLE